MWSFGYVLTNSKSIQNKEFMHFFAETFLTTMFLPLLILTPEEMMPQLAEQSDEAIQVDFSDVKEQEKLAEHCFKHPRYTAVMKKCLPEFDNMGLLDL